MARGFALIRFHGGKGSRRTQIRALQRAPRLPGWPERTRMLRAVPITPRFGVTKFDAFVELTTPAASLQPVFRFIEKHFSHVDGYTF